MEEGKPVKVRCNHLGERWWLGPGGRKGGGETYWIQDMFFFFFFKEELTEFDDGFNRKSGNKRGV